MAAKFRIADVPSSLLNGIHSNAVFHSICPVAKYRILGATPEIFYMKNNVFRLVSYLSQGCTIFVIIIAKEKTQIVHNISQVHHDLSGKIAGKIEKFHNVTVSSLQWRI